MTSPRTACSPTSPATLGGAPVPIRSPQAVRPWQHVLNPLSGYLELAQRLANGEDVRGAWNFGPDPGDVQTVGWLVERLDGPVAEGAAVGDRPGPHPHEAGHLALDSTKARTQLGWRPGWDLSQALEAIVEWYAVFLDDREVRTVTLDQIERFSTLSAR